jgi:hypothetical protein
MTLAVSACSRYELAARWNEMRGDGYALDRVPREIAPDAKPGCPDEVRTIAYRGRHLPYGGVLLVAAAFESKLAAFEQVVVQVATSHYGRAPERVLHFGVQACRSIRGGSGRLSEHALANALDVAGFRFGRAKQPLPPGVPPPLQRAFTVSVKHHWAPTSADATPQLHSRFLRALIERVRADRIFRGIVGPGREGHADHLHLDYAPWRYHLM